jgi:hypothetical protein
MGQLDRITQQPDVMGGKACLRGMRITVGMSWGKSARGTASRKFRPIILTFRFPDPDRECR